MREKSNRPGWMSAAAAFATTFIAGATQSGSLKAAPGGSWDYAVKRDEMGRPHAAYARLKGANGALLWISCSRSASNDGSPSNVTVSATVSQKQFLGQSDGRGRSTVYWFDNRAPEVSHWDYRDRYGQMFGEESVRGFTESLTMSRELKVELSDYRYEPRTTEFKLDPNETKAMTERFSKDCRDISARRSDYF